MNYSICSDFEQHRILTWFKADFYIKPGNFPLDTNIFQDFHPGHCSGNFPNPLEPVAEIFQAGCQ